jgi:AraC family transcriptional activator FtrA
MDSPIPSNLKPALNVAILVDDGIALFELGCAVELFALPRPETKNWYKTEVVSLSEQPLNATGGLTIQPKVVSDLSAYDMLIIPSWSLQRAVSKRISDAVTALYQRGGRVLSFCSGAFLLAEIGILDGKQAITHWRYAEAFKRRYPAIQYVEDVLYLYDQRLGCSAGSSAAIDLGIEVIRSDFGYHVANQVARRMVLAAHRGGGQSQFVETPLPKKASGFSSTLDWAVRNIDQPIDVNLLAEKANMTRRTFDRQFRKSIDMSAKEWLIHQRLDRAKSLLETSATNIEQVAFSSGFETATAMRHNFRKYLSVSPSDYRKQFASSI